MRIYFDTSAINAIINHRDMSTIVRKTSLHFETSFSRLNLYEMLMTSDRMRRLKLFIATSALANGGITRPRILVEEPVILSRCLNAFHSNSDDPDFFYVNTDDDWQQNLLIDPSVTLDEEMVAGVRSRLSSIEPNHLTNMQELREKALLWLSGLSDTDQRSLIQCRTTFLRYFAKDERLLADLVTTRIQSPSITCKLAGLTGYELELLNRFDSWRYALAGSVLDLYDRLLKPEKYGRKNNPGWTDVHQSVYLSATDVFVTHDKQQLRSLRLISVFGKKPVDVWSFQRFLNKLGM